MSLSELKPGQEGSVMQITSEGAVRQRLLDMGILPGVSLKVERIAPAGDPIWIRLQGYQLSIRKKEATSILINSG